MSDEWVMVPRDLLQRVDAALQRHLDRHAPMRIPVDQTDSDLVQSDVQALIAAPAAPLDRSAPARPEDMTAFAAELKADPAKAQSFFQSAGLIDERGELMPEYAAPQQAEPVAWMKFGGSVIHTMLKRGRPELYPEHTIPLYLHPPAAEVQRLRDALENVRLLAARHRKEEWAGHMLRFCADAGVTGSSLREGGE